MKKKKIIPNPSQNLRQQILNNDANKKPHNKSQLQI